MVRSRVLWVVLILCIVSGVAAVLRAQVARSTPATASASLDDLLTEVRGLRADINQTASASIRTELLTARLQLQEQRVYTAGRQITEVQGVLATVRQETRELESTIKVFEDMRVRNPDNEAQQAQLRDMQNQLPQLQAELEVKQRRERELRAHEADLFNTLNTEQTRWTEFNGRLDALERSLTTQGTR